LLFGLPLLLKPLSFGRSWFNGNSMLFFSFFFISFFLSFFFLFYGFSSPSFCFVFWGFCKKECMISLRRCESSRPLARWDLTLQLFFFFKMWSAFWLEVICFGLTTMCIFFSTFISSCFSFFIFESAFNLNTKPSIAATAHDKWGGLCRKIDKLLNVMKSNIR